MGVASENEKARVIGRYILFGEIAAGGMATVHFGRLNGPVGFSRTVAIKRLHPQFAKDPEFVTMFLDEARLAGRIRHPNVVPTLDVVATEGEIFLVMEYVQGESLSRLSRALRVRGAVIPADVAITILAGTLHGLHAAHEAKDEHGQALNIVHRDVSPQNILLGTDGVPRVLDFGVAKAAGRLQTTREGQLKGKISYMAPEQLHGGEVTRQTDIYAAAVVLWESLTGKRLFEGDNEAMVLVKALEGNVPPPSKLVEGLTPAFDHVVARGLSRDAAHRFRTAREMAIALERCGRMASPSEVGEWVEHIAGEELTKRAARIAEIESVSSSGGFRGAASMVTQVQDSARRIEDALTRSDPLPTSQVLPVTGATGPSARSDVESQLSSISVSRPGEALPPPKRRSRAAALFGIAIVAAGLSAVVAIGISRGRAAAVNAPAAAIVLPPGTPGTPDTPVVADPAASSAADPPPPADKVADKDRPTDKPGDKTADRPPEKPEKPEKTERPGAKKPPPVVRPAPPPPPSLKNCDPPFTIDAAGHKKYKLECMTK